MYLLTDPHLPPFLWPQVKLHQDLELKRHEEESARRFRFKSVAPPASTTEPKYERMLLEDQIKRQIRKERRIMQQQKCEGRKRRSCMPLPRS